MSCYSLAEIHLRRFDKSGQKEDSARACALGLY